MAAMNLGSIVDMQRYRRPSMPALITEDAVWTYTELADSAEAFAAYLSDCGIGFGDRVALLGINSAEYVCSLLGICRTGAIAVPLNHRLQADELAYLLRNSGAVAAVADSEFLAALDDVAEGGQLRARVQLYAPVPSRAWLSFQEIQRRYRGRRFPAAEVQPGDIQRIMYTSGTTSRPKGVIVTHQMVAYNILGHGAELGLSAADRILVASPLYHVAAWDAPGVGVLFYGGALVIMRKFNAEAALRLIEEHRISGAHLVRPVVREICASLDASRNVSTLRWLIIGGVPPELYNNVQAMLPGVRLVQGYGMTEACSAIAYIDAEHAQSKLGTVGTAVPFIEYRVVNSAGADAGPYMNGEIVVRGPKVTPGYWADEEATEKAWQGGWFRTGDAGSIDGDGYLTITDRIKDMIKSGGENIASQEVEQVIAGHPAVAEVAVIGIPDPRWQEVPMAFVVLNALSDLTEQELIEYCRSHLASFKTPRSVAFVSSLPRNPSGKVLKGALREYAADIHRSPGAVS
jgi:fatty-acyl-CoA synthase